MFFLSSLTQLLITPVVAGEKVEREGRCRSVSPERRIEELLGLVGWLVGASKVYRKKPKLMRKDVGDMLQTVSSKTLSCNHSLILV